MTDPVLLACFIGHILIGIGHILLAIRRRRFERMS